MTDQDQQRATAIVNAWLDEITGDLLFSPGAKRVLVVQIAQALSEARGEAREQQKNDLTRVDTMGSPTDSRTASKDGR